MSSSCTSSFLVTCSGSEGSAPASKRVPARVSGTTCVGISRSCGLIHCSRRGSVAVLRETLVTLLLTEEHVGILVPSRSFDDAQRFILVDPDRTEFDQRPIKAATPGPSVEPEDEPLSFRDVLVAREQEVQVCVAIARDRSSRTRTRCRDVAGKELQAGVGSCGR